MCFRGIDIIDDLGIGTRRVRKGHELPGCRSRLGLHSRAARENERDAYDFDQSITFALLLRKTQTLSLSLSLSLFTSVAPDPFRNDARFFLRSAYQVAASYSLVINISYVPNVHARGFLR